MSVLRCVLGAWNDTFCTFLVPRVLFIRSLTDSELQKQFNDSINKGLQWIHLTRVLENIPGREIATLLAEVDDEHIVLKMQDEIQAHKERDISKRLEQRDLSGFVRFACMMKCSPNSTEMLGANGTTPQASPDNGSSTMVATAMKYYPNGSLEEYLKRYNPPWNRIVPIACEVVRIVYGAYITAQFCHGDLFAKNVLLDHDLNPVITNFDKASFDCPGFKFWIDLTVFFDDVGRHAPQSSQDGGLNDIVLQHVLQHICDDPTADLANSIINALELSTTPLPGVTCEILNLSPGIGSPHAIPGHQGPAGTPPHPSAPLHATKSQR